MIVSGWGKAGKVTISNNEFDGVTEWSSGCNGKHYWTALLIGSEDYYTFVGNWLHDLSGRAPHMGTTENSALNFFHAVNNYFTDIEGHAFDISASGTYALFEGNYFDSVTTPVTAASLTDGAHIYSTVTVAESSACLDYIGYNCEWNKAYSSGSYPDVADTSVLTRAAQYQSYLIGHIGVADVPSSVIANAGVGRI